MGLRVNKDQDQGVTKCKWLKAEGREKAVLEVSGVVGDTHKHHFQKGEGNCKRWSLFKQR